MNLVFSSVCYEKRMSQKTPIYYTTNVLKTLAKSVLIQLGLTAAASATDAAIHRKMFGSGRTTLIISNEEMNDIIRSLLKNLVY